MYKIILIAITLFCANTVLAQNYIVQGIVFDDQNLRPLDQVLIEVVLDETVLSNFIETDFRGGFTLELPVGQNYQLNFIRSGYRESQINTSGKDFAEDYTSQIRVGMYRLPGYEFEATIKDFIGSGKKLGKEIKNFKIEIFNNTTSIEVKVVEEDPSNSFMTNFERGNHYTMLLRKKGYFAKRIEVFVNIEGCILCFEGLGNAFIPEINQVTTDKNEKGSLITDIPMRKIIKDEVIRLDNIYYDFNKWEIRPDAREPLNYLVSILKRNPVTIELASHTDPRGTDEYNQILSDKRAEAAQNYILAQGIKSSRLISKGYGESVPLNNCNERAACTEAEFQINRRTEFKVTGFIDASSFDNKTLRQIIEEERINKRRSVEVLNDINK